MYNIEMKLASCLILLVVFAFSAHAQNSNKITLVPDSGDRKLKVLKKPFASARGCSGSGLARFRITFDRSGKISSAAIVRTSGCRSFDESANEAAWKIKFEPEIRNGEPVTVSRLVEYSFSVY